MPSLGVLHTSHFRLHKKVGLIFLVLMYPAWAVQKTEYSAPQAPPVPLQSGSIAELDVILRSGAARSMPFCPDGVCLPTQIAGRRRPWDQYGLSGAYAASWPAEYSKKCTVLPRGPVCAAKTMPMSLSASPFCCTDFSECRARISQPGSRGGPEGMKFVASSARKGKHLMCFPSCAGL